VLFATSFNPVNRYAGGRRHIQELLMNQPHFLFLQGMQSPFFKRVGKCLEDRNCRVSRINLCMGDRLFWSGENCFSFRGKPSEWPDYIKTFYDENAVTDLVLVGEQRKYHKTAVQVAKDRGIRVIVTDFGYLRPDWIALERDGMNGNSLLPKNIKEISALNRHLPVVSLDNLYPDSEIRMILNDLLYCGSNLFNPVLFPCYRRSDMRPNPIKGYCYSILKWLKLLYHYKETKRFVDRMEAGQLNYFLVAMQLEHDFQIVSYSNYQDMIAPLREIIASFSKHCSSDCDLVIKNHPRDLGIRHWQTMIDRLSSEYGVDGRVRFVDGGTSIDKCLKHARGLVTVNSTAGLRALQLGCAVKNLSDAIYDIQGLTYQGSLDKFWANPERPDSENVAHFVNFIAAKMHIRGVFFKEPGLTRGVNAFAKKLYDQEVGV